MVNCLSAGNLFSQPVFQVCHKKVTELNSLWVYSLNDGGLLSSVRGLSLRKIGLLSVAIFVVMAMAQPPKLRQCGQASWYAIENMTASGEMMDPTALTAAHREFGFGTKVRVTNESNGRSVIVRINDRGPFTKGRIIDVSKAAAAELDFISNGHTQVCIQKVE